MKITKREVDRLQPKAKGDLVVWDDELRGFGLRIKPSGAGAYVIQYRNIAGVSRRMTIGRVGVNAPDQMRDLARKYLAEALSGGDPANNKQEARSALTVAGLCDLYLEAAKAGRVTTRFGAAKRPSTLLNDESRIRRHIRPLIGKQRVSELTRQVVQRMADDISAGRTSTIEKTKPRGLARVKGGGVVATRVVELLGGIWTWGERRGYCSGQSPIRGVEKIKAVAKDRVLSSEELKQLGDEMARQQAKRPLVVAALKIIALTGARRQEIVGLRWSEIDEVNSCLRLAQTKTGKSMRPLGNAALDLIKKVPRIKGCDFVFPNVKLKGSADYKKAFSEIFSASRLSEVSSHDLRRTYASKAAEMGFSDSTISEMIGHVRRGVTQIHYVHLPDTRLVAAADAVSGVILNHLHGREADVILLRPKNIG